MVFGRSADHGRTTDIDIFNGFFKCAIGFSDRCLKRIEVHNNDIDRINVVVSQGFHMFRIGAASQNTRVDLRIECFDTTVKHFRETRVIGHFLNFDSCLSDQFGGTARGEQVIAQSGEFASELHDSGLIRHTQQSLFTHNCCP